MNPFAVDPLLAACAGLLLGIVLTFAVLWWIASWPSRPTHNRIPR